MHPYAGRAGPLRLRCTYNFHLGDEKMRTRIIRKMIGASLLAVTLLTASFAMHEVAYAKETSVNISGKQYELAEKSKYDYDDGTTPTIISSSGS